MKITAVQSHMYLNKSTFKMPIIQQSFSMITFPNDKNSNHFSYDL